MLEFLIVLALIVCNAFFALSEMSVVTSRRARLKQQASASRGARRALELAEHPERFLSTVQVGITLIGILTGMFGGKAIGHSIGAWLGTAVPMFAEYAPTIGLVLAVGLITYLTIVLGELLPKRLALLAPERLAAGVALPMHAIARIATPAVWLLSASVRGALRLLRLADTQAAHVSEEEIRLLVSESHEQGVIDTDERNMMNRVLRLGDRSAESLMTPRTRVAWLDAGESFEENLAVMRRTPFSRYPVYRDSDADVLGVLEVKSLIDRIDEREFDLFKYLRETLFVSESTPALKLLEIFREEQQSLALVVDEYGDVTGLITVNDLLEAVIGRTQTGEGADATPLVTVRDDGSLLVDGGLTVDNVRELLGGGPLPGEDEHDYHTAAGMVIARFGRIPNTGEWFEWNGWRIEVVDLDGPRVDKLLLQPPPEADADDDR
ncbi:HlyC/CorC family transporter [Luteimonas sp. SJ-92]|uniref:HlyC/CorC family transporter n=1 Tax=Luteimonas salinisoli TaxID=2752307 RepID=A0A853JI38_9GAMM|nr:hemolysin family protein [Luteimonas salinisoli]NZA28098.1 HlyC/CorC family transporter [Luteimonas salinisoli]